MKKIVFFIICLFSIINHSNAFFGSATSLDLYKNIDSWIDELQSKMFEYEINWWPEEHWVIEEIHFLAALDNKPICLDKSKQISNETFKEIVENQDIKTLYSYMNEYCINDWNITNDLLLYYLMLFNTHYEKSINQSEEKSEKIYKISNIWIYSDWILENSWFDLIEDMQEIDKVIFGNKNNYNWDSELDLWDTINWLTDKINKDMQELANKPIKILELKNNTNEQEEQVQTNGDVVNTNTNYVCPDNTENSLSSNSLNNILDDLEENLTNSWTINNSDSKTTESNKKEPKPTIVKDWEYTKITDHSMFPCNSFFCITIEFVMYNHSLFGWWEDVSIEYLLNRSNKHLRKFASTSLVPAKMTIWNFELGLDQLNLPEIFHLGFQVSKKPIPILNLDKKEKKDETELAAKSMLKRYYEANWLDYTRRNDLVLLAKLEQEKQSVQNSAELTPKTALQKQQEYEDYLKNKQESSEYITKAIQKKASYWSLQQFEEQFIELERFTLGLTDYTWNLKSIIKKMNEEIPTY